MGCLGLPLGIPGQLFGSLWVLLGSHGIPLGGHGQLFGSLWVLWGSLGLPLGTPVQLFGSLWTTWGTLWVSVDAFGSDLDTILVDFWILIHICSYVVETARSAAEDH